MNRCVRVCIHAGELAAYIRSECAAVYLGGCSWGGLRGGGQGQAPPAGALLKKLCCLMSQVAVGPGLCDCVEMAG